VVHPYSTSASFKYNLKALVTVSTRAEQWAPMTAKWTLKRWRLQ